jgi:integrase/recombinase XerD
MLNIYTRHTAHCQHATDMRWRRCRCPKWIRGVLPNGVAIRQSAKTRSWEHAERQARRMEADIDPMASGKPRRVTVREAVEMFLSDEAARGLKPVSRKKSKTLFERQFRPWCEARKLLESGPGCQDHFSSPIS